MSSEPESVEINTVIPFDDGVDAMFFSNMLKSACRHLKIKDKELTIPNCEAIRRAISLIEGIITGTVDITHSR